MPSSKTRNARELGIAAGVLLLCMLPLFFAFARFGYSSGHDVPFHLQSWQDASWQLRHGIYPQWDFTAAHGVGEPRFVFYPPISWLLGAVLSMVVGIPRTADAFIVAALLCCGLSMFLSLRRYVAAPAAVAAAVFFALNPYMLFNGLERSAFGELLASAWLPPLVVAAIDSRPRVRSVAVPFALLWLTNIPTAIIGSYLLLGIMCLRLLQFVFLQQRDGRSSQGESLRYASVCVLGAILGLLLTAFFLVPAIHQEHYVQLNTAFIEGQNYKDSFLLRHTPYSSRQVIHAVSLITAQLLGFFALLSGTLLYITRKNGSTQSQHRVVLLGLVVLAAVVTFLLLPMSSIAWQYVPELSVLQFPWRLLGVLTLLCSFALAMVLDTLRDKRFVLVAMALVLGWFLAITGQRQYWLYRDAPDQGQSREQVVAATEKRPTNEYTPIGADNTNLHEADKGYWLGDQLPQDFNGGPVDLPVRVLPKAEAPQHLQVNFPRPAVLVLNLRAYPSWRITSNGQPLPIDTRPDGRIALSLPAGISSLDVRWHRGVDEICGVFVSLLAVIAVWLIAKKQHEVNDR